MKLILLHSFHGQISSPQGNQVMLKRLAFFLLMTHIPFLSLAHAYWLEVKGSGKVNEPVNIQVCHGEIDDYSVRHREKGNNIAQIATFKLFVVNDKGERTDVLLHQLNDCWEGDFIPKTTGAYQILGINEELPVIDRSQTGGPNIRPIQYLCAAYTIGPTAEVKTPQQFLDITTSGNGKGVTAHVFKDKKPVAGNTKLRIFNPENWEKIPVTNAQGEVPVVPTMKGLYIIRQDWIDQNPGTYKGIPYESVRHRCDYSLQVD